MPSSKEYKDFILEQLELSCDISCKPMMGEYLLYKNGLLFGGIYDNRLLVKITKTNDKFALIKQLPYSGAKPMYLIEDVDDKKQLQDIINATVSGLKK